METFLIVKLVGLLQNPIELFFLNDRIIIFLITSYCGGENMKADLIEFSKLTAGEF